MRAWLAASVGLHAFAVLSLLPWPPGRGGAVPAPPIEVELVELSSAGGAPSAPAAPDAPPTPPTPAPQDGAEPAPAPRPSATAARRPAPAAPEVNLGNAGQALADLSVTGENVVPPRLDSRHRNLPPAYPAEAARRGIEGVVRLLIHVTPDGVPILVEIAQSSGSAVLDRAAQAAIERWRFNPAVGPDGPVPFDYPLQIRFTRDAK